MKSFVLVTGDFVKTGGMDRANHALASFLAKRGDDVHLVAYRAADDLLAQKNVTFHAVKKIRGSYFLSSPRLKREGMKWARDIAKKGGRVVVNGGNCPFDDVNWVHHVHAADQPPLAGGFAHRFKIAFSRRLFCREEKKTIPGARTILTGCVRTKTDLIEKLGVDGAKVYPVYYGVDAKLFQPADPAQRAATRTLLGWDDRPYVAFIGALGDRRKGFDRLFEAWAKLCQQKEWDAKLVVVGRGKEQPLWQERAKARGLLEGNRMQFLGFVKDLPGMLAACDAHVLPSRYEGYSLVTQEAICSGIPAFVTNTAGIAERFPTDLHNLLLPDTDDITELVHRLSQWRRDIPGYRAKVAPFSQELRSCTWEAMAEKIVEIIEAN